MRLGELEVTPIIDAEGTFATVGEVFPTLTAEAEAKARAEFPELFHGDQWWLPMQVTLIRSPDAVVLIDTGLGPAPRDFVPDAETYLLEALEARGIEPDAVDLVVHTHLHVDHVGWNGGFPRARYLVHEHDLAFFTTPAALEERPHLRERLLPLQRAGVVEPVAGETEIVPGVYILPTFGHTPGHVSVRVEAGGKAVVILGDVIVHPLQVADPDLLYVSDNDDALAARTRRRVLGELADEGVPVIVAHFYGAGRFIRHGQAFGWKPAKDDGTSVE